MLSVRNLAVQFQTPDGVVFAVNDVSFNLNAGETLGIVGESGSGKSQLMLSLLGLLADNGQVEGEAWFEEQNLLQLSAHELNKIRGNKIAMIFQDPMTALNPYLRIGKQMTEMLIRHKGVSKKDAEQQAISMLNAVQIPNAKNRLKSYPHEFSGGMRQRVMIAMALLCKPDILIADEPTTALDVTVQAQILKLLRELKRDFDTAIILITHDLGVVAGLCDR
ncbi:MAG: ATP-binding cassette domain-containing protein, partial [Gammaproteobacteria bacterium]|nr:ATP-binding cassette domain-containing protein [Gammaproteobacteria bacterium]